MMLNPKATLVAGLFSGTTNKLATAHHCPALSAALWTRGQSTLEWLMESALSGAHGGCIFLMSRMHAHRCNR